MNQVVSCMLSLIHPHPRCVKPQREAQQLGVHSEGVDHHTHVLNGHVGCVGASVAKRCFISKPRAMTSKNFT